MGLFSSFQRQKPNARPPRAATPQDAAQAETLRVRARRRLIGAAVLVIVAVLVLPLVFESRPRPLDPAIAIDVGGRAAVPGPAAPNRDGSPASPAVQPSAGASRPAVVAGVAAESPPADAVPRSAPSADRPVMTAAQPVDPSVVDKAAAGQAAADKVAQAHAADAARVAEAKAAEAKAAAAQRAAAEKAAAAKAAERLAQEKVAAAVASGGARFVVQVGAFADPAAVRDAHQRLDKLGLRASDQDVDTPNGRRTRVRIGPFGSRDEADRTLARLRAAGLPGAVLPL